MRRARAYAAALAAAASMTACGSDGAGESGDRKVVFGAVVELSGSQQVYGRPAKSGLEAAAAAINAEGGITVAGDRYEAAVEVADDRSDPNAVANAARQVMRARPVAALGQLSERVSYELWRPAGIIMFASGFALQEPLQNEPEEHPLLFTPVPLYGPLYDSNMRRVAALFPDIARVAILAPSGEQGKGALETFEASAKTAGMRVVHGALFPQETTDFSALLTTIKGESPDLLIALQSAEQAVTIMQQAAQLDVARYALNDAITPAQILEARGLEDLEVIIPGFSPSFSEAATIPDYDPEAIFGDAEPPSVPGATIAMYYAYRLLAQAIEQAGTVDDTDAIAEALVGQTHDGPFGTCTMTQGHAIHCELLVEVVRDGAIDVYRFAGPEATQPSAEYVCRSGTCSRR